MRNPIYRDITDPRTNRLCHFVLTDLAVCEKCNQIREMLFSGETPDEYAHWECAECGELNEQLNTEKSGVVQ